MFISLDIKFCKVIAWLPMKFYINSVSKALRTAIGVNAAVYDMFGVVVCPKHPRTAVSAMIRSVSVLRVQC